MQLPDIPQVQYVAKTAWNKTYRDIIPNEIQEKFLNEAYSNDMLKHRMEHSLMLVAEVNHTIIGFSNFSSILEKKEAELLAIYLLPSYQRNGMGSALLQAGMKELKDVERLYVNVETENIIGYSFYQAYGFLVIDEFNDWFEGHMLKTTRMCMTVDSKSN